MTYQSINSNPYFVFFIEELWIQRLSQPKKESSPKGPAHTKLS